MSDTQKRFFELAKQAEREAKIKARMPAGDLPPDVPEELRLQPSDRDLPQVKKSNTPAVLVAVFCVLLVVCGGLVAGWFGYTNWMFQKPMDEVTQEPENAGFRFKVTPDLLLQNLTVDATEWPSDARKKELIRVFMTYAGKVKERDFKQVTLASQGVPRFTVEGEYFKELGEKYGVEHDLKLIRTFPEHVTDMKGQQPYPHIDATNLEEASQQLGCFAKLIDAWTVSDTKK